MNIITEWVAEQVENGEELLRIDSCLNKMTVGYTMESLGRTLGVLFTYLGEQDGFYTYRVHYSKEKEMNRVKMSEQLTKDEMASTTSMDRETIAHLIVGALGIIALIVAGILIF